MHTSESTFRYELKKRRKTLTLDLWQTFPASGNSITDLKRHTRSNNLTNTRARLQVVEFDEPATLLSNPNSQFSKMIEAAANIQDTAISPSVAPLMNNTSDSTTSTSNSCHDNPSFVADDDEKAFWFLREFYFLVIFLMYFFNTLLGRLLIQSPSVPVRPLLFFHF